MDLSANLSFVPLATSPPVVHSSGPPSSTTPTIILSSTTSASTSVGSSTASPQNKFFCPICSKPFKSSVKNKPPVVLWQHINSVHIARHQFPPKDFITQHDRLMCSSTSCHYIYHNRFWKLGCQRVIGDAHVKCGSSLVDPSILTQIPFATHISQHSERPLVPPSHLTSSNSVSTDSSTLLDLSLTALENVSFNCQHASLEPQCIYHLLNCVMTSHVPTVKHIPKSCRSLLGEVLFKEFRYANSKNVWGAIRLLLVAKCTLRVPVRGGRRRLSATASLICSCLQRWLSGDVRALFLEVLESNNNNKSSRKDIKCNQKSSNLKRCLQQAKEGHYGRAIRAISSNGIASPGDSAALKDLIDKHPLSTSPLTARPLSSPLSVDIAQVLAKTFLEALAQAGHSSEHNTYLM